MPIGWRILRCASSQISAIVAAVYGSVGVQDLLPETCTWNTHPERVARDRREITDDQHWRVVLRPVSHKPDRGLGRIVANPCIPVCGAIFDVKRRHIAVEPVQVADQVLDALVRRLLCRAPIQFFVVVPFFGLGEFAPFVSDEVSISISIEAMKAD